jgi:CRISP-associated protein Cas1
MEKQIDAQLPDWLLDELEEDTVASPEPELLPARMVNEFVYCPRLAFLEWVQGEWDDNVDTVAGRWVHRRADDAIPREVPSADAGDASRPLTARALLLSAPVLGAIARIDVLELEGAQATPVEYKKGSPPDTPNRAWDPERVQLCLQGLILRENGYGCTAGVLYFAETKQRVEVTFDFALQSQTEDALRGLSRLARDGKMPLPLVDSPKCVRCSLNGICLPDETNALLRRAGSDDVRRLVPGRPEARPLYVQEQRATVRKRGEALVVDTPTGAPIKVPGKDISSLVLHGNVQVTTQTIRALMDDGVPVAFHSQSGWYLGSANGGIGHRNVMVRLHQHRMLASDRQHAVARSIVVGKLVNQRVMLRRNLGTRDPQLTARLAVLVRQARVSTVASTLLGLEGAGARLYFGAFARMLNSRSSWAAELFAENGRNRRPPRDPVNAVLSFLYAQLARECTTAAMVVGFDPFIGFLHEPHYGRPSLALDLMEEFRPLVADSVCITLFNQAELGPDAFHSRARGVMLTPAGRKIVLAGLERRLEQLVLHPVFGYQVSYRRLFELQARVLRLVVMGEVSEYRPFTTR